VVLSEKDPNFTYVGVTGNLLKRLNEHNKGESKSTKGRGPFRLVYFEGYKTRSETRKREYYFKKDFGGVRLKKEIISAVRHIKR